MIINQNIMVRTYTTIENLKRSKMIDPLTERQRFGCLDTWPCNCKQTPSLQSPILNRQLTHLT